MRATTSLHVTICGLLLVPSAAWAQTLPAREGQNQVQVTLVTEPEGVQFVAPGASWVWRLEVLSSQGEPIFDTGAVTGERVEWKLVNSQAQPVESGLYRYTLMIRTDQGAEVRMRQGQLQIERVRNVYRVDALESEAGPSDGVMLSLMNTAETTIGGSAPGATGSAAGSVAPPAPTGAPLQPVLRGLSLGIQSGTGTTGSISKWIDGPNGVLGDTQITENNGFMTVGNTSFRGNIHIFGAVNNDLFSGMGVDLNVGPAFNYGYSGASFGRSSGFFNVRPDALAIPPNPSLRFATANVQRMIVTNTGDVGVGIILPVRRLQVVNDGGRNGTILVGSADIFTAGDLRMIGFGDLACGEACVYIAEQDADDRMVLRADNFRFRDGHVFPDVDGVQNLGDAALRWNTVFATNGTINTSDARLKADVKNIDDGLASVLKLRPVSFTWKSQPDGTRHLGLLAQEVEAVIPEVIFRDATRDVPLGINYTSLLPVVIKAIQEQQTAWSRQDAAIKSLEAENAALRQRNDELDARLRALEQAIQRLTRPTEGRPSDKRQQ
jgi:hypothetical protein